MNGNWKSHVIRAAKGGAGQWKMRHTWSDTHQTQAVPPSSHGSHQKPITEPEQDGKCLSCKDRKQQHCDCPSASEVSAEQQLCPVARRRSCTMSSCCSASDIQVPVLHSCFALPDSVRVSAAPDRVPVAATPALQLHPKLWFHYSPSPSQPPACVNL